MNIKKPLLKSGASESGLGMEIGIKQALSKLKVPESLLPVIQDEGFEELPINGQHAELASRLPTITAILSTEC
jgi:hypothetical protein